MSDPGLHMPSVLLRALREHVGRDVLVETTREEAFRGQLLDVDSHFNLILADSVKVGSDGSGARAGPKGTQRVIRGDAVLYLVL